jgi:uncharacterized lipoprotein YmbA
VTDRRTVPQALAVLLAAVLLAGCGLMRRPEIHHYSLEVIAPAAQAAALAPPSPVAALPVGLAAIVLPPGLDRQEVAVRRDDGRLDVRGTELWAAPLGAMVLHALAFDLAARLPEGAVVLPGQARPAGAMRALDIAFEDLAAGPERVLALDARWTLRTPGAPDLTRREQIAAPLASLDSAEIAAGTSRALAELAERIAAELAPQ